MIVNHTPSPAEEWGTHDSSGKNNLWEWFKILYHRLIKSVYLVGGRVEVRVDHRRVHFPFLEVSGLSKFLPGLDLVVDAKK